MSDEFIAADLKQAVREELEAMSLIFPPLPNFLFQRFGLLVSA